MIPSSSCNSRLAVSKGHRNPYKYSTAAHPLGRESRGSYNSFPHFFVPMFVAWAWMLSRWRFSPLYYSLAVILPLLATAPVVPVVVQGRRWLGVELFPES